jgi:hypothetical protein
VAFESFDHALAVCMVANQYQIHELKLLASNFLTMSFSTYVREIEDDWDKLKAVYYLVDALDLKYAKVSVPTSRCLRLSKACVCNQR